MATLNSDWTAFVSQIWQPKLPGTTEQIIVDNCSSAANFSSFQNNEAVINLVGFCCSFNGLSASLLMNRVSLLRY